MDESVLKRGWVDAHSCFLRRPHRDRGDFLKEGDLTGWSKVSMADGGVACANAFDRCCGARQGDPLRSQSIRLVTEQDGLSGQDGDRLEEGLHLADQMAREDDGAGLLSNSAINSS